MCILFRILVLYTKRFDQLKKKMAAKRTSKTKHQQIIDYWSSRVYEEELSIDFSEANERCWRCGYKSRLEKCHIVPHSLGGKDEPNNYVLLCKLCHEENPNVSNPKIMWDWLKAHKTDFYDTYWTLRGMEEYKFIYGKSLEQEFEQLGIKQEEASLLLRNKMNEASWHFGRPRMNSATIAGIFRMMIMEFKNHSKIK